MHYRYDAIRPSILDQQGNRIHARVTVAANKLATFTSVEGPASIDQGHNYALEPASQ